MLFDILIELSSEKIRQDFGDLCATIFQVITYQNGCSLKELNFFFPNLNYSVLRTSLYILFQHNIIFFPINSQENSPKHFFIEKLKLFSRIYEPIYRLRHFRFISLSRHEYGNKGQKLIEYFLKKGQVFLNNIFEKIILRINCFKSEIEELLIHLARDGFIESIFGVFFLKNKIENSKNKKKNPKPVIKKQNFSWKISTRKFNLLLRLNLVIEIANEYYGEKISGFIRTKVCKIIGINYNTFFLIWFSIDTLKDNIKDVDTKITFNEIFIFQTIEDFGKNNFFFDLKKSVLKINIKIFLEIIHEKIIGMLISNQFGNKFALVFKILREKSISSEKEIENEITIDSLDLRKIIYKMYKIGYIFMEEKGKFFDFFNFKKGFFWKINFGFVKKRINSELLKSLYNLIIKLEDLEIIVNKFLLNKNYEKNKICKFNYLNSQIKILILSLRRLDELLLLLYF
jgi:transcription initiation factor IIE alpha subunit